MESSQVRGINPHSFPVAPVSPAAGYIGGKRNLAKRIVSIIDLVEHRSYAEPFVGMGGIFLRRTRQVKSEAINDISGDVATFFRILQEHFPYFIDMMRWRVSSRVEFERLRGMDPDRLTDLQRAVRFLYLQRLAFGGKVSGRNFGVDRTQGARFNIAKLEPMLAEIHERLAGVQIERLAYGEFIRRYDSVDSLFYLDPPYWGCEEDYGQDVFAPADFALLAAQLGTLRGKFLLSINDTAGARSTFAEFHMAEVETTWSLSTANSGGAKRVRELLISNFDLPV